MRNKILVVGDAMIDRHIYGQTSRMSPEAPVPVVHHHEEEWALGAAANVASHITSAGMQCFFAYKATTPTNLKLMSSKGVQSSLGGRHKPEWMRFANMAADNNILLRPLHTAKPTPITIKTRIWSNGQQICRIDEEDVSRPDSEFEKLWIESLIDIIEQNAPRVVVFSDYNKGTLTDEIIDRVSAHCSMRGIVTILDPKRPSFPSLKNVHIIKPNVREVELTNLSPSDCSRILEDTTLINTLGKDGMAAWCHGDLIFECRTEASEVVDVCGCGDTVTALLAIATAKGYGMGAAIKSANKGASFTIKHKGCYVLTKKEIMQCLQRI
jgi:D-beta-D-heptose 7-phosphate kinase/D-beta-D-heptose 1-phosphate adenosyltransferase